MCSNKQILASGCQDETIKFWRVKAEKCLTTLRVPRPYEGMNITGVTGLNQATTATFKALGALKTYTNKIGNNTSIFRSILQRQHFILSLPLVELIRDRLLHSSQFVTK